MRKIVITFLLICVAMSLFSDTALADVRLKKAVLAATSLDSYKLSCRLKAAEDKAGLAMMLGENKLVYLPAGARISILNSTKVFGHVVKTIKMISTDGYYKSFLSDRALWVAATSLM